MTKLKNFINHLMDENMDFSFDSARSHVKINHIILEFPRTYSEIELCVTEGSTFYRVDMSKPFVTQAITHSAEAILNTMQSFVPDKIDAFFDPIAMTAGYHGESDDPESMLRVAEVFLDELNEYLEEAVDAVEKKNAMARYNLLEPLK